MLFIIVISVSRSLRAVRPEVVILCFTNKTVSEIRWEVANKFDNLVIGIFYSAVRIYICINNRISFVFRDSALSLRGFMEVGANVDMRVSVGVGVL